MPLDRRRLLIAATTLFVLVLLVWSCSGDSDSASPDGTETTTTTEPGPPTPPAFIPVTGGTNESGQPEPPPIHAVFSVVVRGSTSWEPYAGAELTGLDEEAARAIADRLRQIDVVLREAGIRGSIELAHGPAAALCAIDPEVLIMLERRGHRVAMHARSNGEAFRAHAALAECGRVPTTASGLATMADPIGPGEPTRQSLVDATAVLSVLDIRQVVGQVSPVCTALGLAAPTHGYGTGAFTAPWRSAWTEDNPCADTPGGRIVMIDQTRFGPVEGADRINQAAIGVLANRVDQMLAYALDRRFDEPGDLPLPGVITWGVTVRLDDLIAPAPAEDNPDEDGDDSGEAGDNIVVDPRTAPLSADTLGAFAELARGWRPSLESQRLRWMLPEDVAAILRPV